MAEPAGISVTLVSDLQLCPYAHTQPQLFQLYRLFSIPWHLSLHVLDKVFSQSRNYDIIRPSQGGLESGVWIDEYNYQNKDKISITKSMSLFFFFRAMYYSKKHVIPHSVIAAILDVILSISKRRKQQQYAGQILQIQPLLKIIRKILINCDQVNFAFKWRPSWTHS